MILGFIFCLILKSQLIISVALKIPSVLRNVILINNYQKFFWICTFQFCLVIWSKEIYKSPTGSNSLFSYDLFKYFLQILSKFIPQSKNHTLSPYSSLGRCLLSEEKSMTEVLNPGIYGLGFPQWLRHFQC